MEGHSRIDFFFFFSNQEFLTEALPEYIASDPVLREVFILTNVFTYYEMYYGKYGCMYMRI